MAVNVSAVVDPRKGNAPVTSSYSYIPFAFARNFGGRTVASGETLGPLPMFAIEIPADAPVGKIYTGSFFVDYTTVAGGPSSPIPTNRVAFVFTVTSLGTTPVPEPATLVLLGTGLAGIASRVRKRRSVSPDA